MKHVMTVMITKSKRRSYELSFKLKVIELAKESDNCAAARAFNFTEKRGETINL